MDEEKTEETSQTIRGWIQDNLRIIISVVIVIAIAGGIYSYSKRTQTPAGTEEQGAIEQLSEEAAEVGEEAAVTTPQEEEKAEASKSEEQVTAGASKETEGSFIETAGRGDGVTHLARRALANYLEKNPDSSLTPEHKIYIEDYLRKHAEFKGRVFVGTSAEFNKDLIRQAIEQSKQLNDKQLKNLHKYAVMVPSLS
ncbi:MAG: hypothetical protein NT136_01345 [Candidatus Moranbacteria bacterium]|nr:hypothetical protein [Candidatus Moranbacteria bacterium]